MMRQFFLVSLLALASATSWLSPAVAAEGRYETLDPAQPTNVAAGKVEVLEFFWYGCPHCYALEPQMTLWNRRKPAYVEFVRIPGATAPISKLHARLFYTLEALGRGDLHAQVFDTIHRTGNLLAVSRDDKQSLQLQLEFAAKYGIGREAFMRAYDSPEVAAKVSAAEQLAKRYLITAVPTLVVNGKYKTDPVRAGGHAEDVIAVLTELTASEKPR